MSKERV